MRFFINRHSNGAGRNRSGSSRVFSIGNDGSNWACGMSASLIGP